MLDTVLTYIVIFHYAKSRILLYYHVHSNDIQQRESASVDTPDMSGMA